VGRRALLAAVAASLLAGCGYTRIGGASGTATSIWLQPVINRTIPFERDVAYLLDRAVADELVARGYTLTGANADSTLQIHLNEVRETTLVQDATGGRRDGLIAIAMTVVWENASGSLLDGGAPSITVRVTERFSIAIGETAAEARRAAFRRVAPRVADVLRSKEWNPTDTSGDEETPDDDAFDSSDPYRSDA
jgi:hypothetical protein